MLFQRCTPLYLKYQSNTRLSGKKRQPLSVSRNLPKSKPARSYEVLYFIALVLLGCGLLYVLLSPLQKLGLARTSKRFFASLNLDAKTAKNVINCLVRIKSIARRGEVTLEDMLVIYKHIDHTLDVLSSPRHLVSLLPYDFRALEVENIAGVLGVGPSAAKSLAEIFLTPVGNTTSSALVFQSEWSGLLPFGADYLMLCNAERQQVAFWWTLSALKEIGPARQWDFTPRHTLGIPKKLAELKYKYILEEAAEALGQLNYIADQWQ
uniref:Uncharacterized protein n=1 Tax=Chromera velia TaxID=505693 RepID=D9IXG8_9ALVE|nr:hypothetical protein CHVEC_pgp001 [Chromera velia]YP_003795334.1 hypothetical protein CHVEC_pgp002 [Chromera velia]ADJ66497.1 hypothetical protein [Chromera velia]ADJ66576.1 hypothetical protein [Chromera velia]